MEEKKTIDLDLNTLLLLVILALVAGGFAVLFMDVEKMTDNIVDSTVTLDAYRIQATQDAVSQISQQIYTMAMECKQIQITGSGNQSVVLVNRECLE